MIPGMRQLPASPLSLRYHLPERSSPSRVRYAAQNQRALDRSGPFRKLSSKKGKGGTANAKPFSACSRLLPPAGRPRPKIRAPPLTM
jgi:hypothetical protein